MNHLFLGRAYRHFVMSAVILAAVAFGEVRRNKEYQAETKRLGTECQNVGTAYDGTTDEKVRTIYKCSDGKLIIR